MKFRSLIYFSLCLNLLATGHFVFAQDLTPNDPDYAKQWYLSKLDMPAVWGKTEAKKSMIIAVIDSGVDVSHPDLHDNIWVNQDEILGDGLDNDNNGYIDDISGWDFITGSNDPLPKYTYNCPESAGCLKEAVYHGTFISGVIAAMSNNSLGIAGMSWQAKIMPLRVLSQDGSGNTLDVVAAIEYAIDNGADIINISFVGDTFDLSLQQALEKAYQKGIIIVAAAGNEDSTGHRVNLDINKNYPVCHEGSNGENIVIGVGAVDQNNQLARFSDYGSSCIDVMAPGQDFFGLLLFDPLQSEFNQYYGGDFSGTSLAAPIVSGLAALVKSVNPTLTNQQVRDLILNNTDNIDSQNSDFAGKLGRGLVNPVKVFQSLITAVSSGSLIKSSGSSVYYYAVDGKRYVFPDTNVYFSWYSDFQNIKQISANELAQITLGGNVTMRPGIKLVKIISSPQVYAVSRGGVLHLVKSEELAESLYGKDWRKMVIDISDAYFGNYQIGNPLEAAGDYSPLLEKNQAVSIDWDKNLSR